MIPERPLQPLPSPYVPHACGLMHLPRMMEKLRRWSAGELEAYYLPTVGQGFDRMLAEHLGVPFSRFVEIGQEAGGSAVEAERRLGDILAGDLGVAVWNRRLVQRGLVGYGRFRLERRKAALGLADRVDLRTMGDLIEFLEGRIE